MTGICDRATVTCPECGHQSRETMPVDACLYLYQCAGCDALLRPKQGDCCVFCSFADVPCPPIQTARLTGEPTGCCF